MKQFSLLILVTLLVFANCQDQWKSQYFEWPYPIVEDTLTYCAQPYPVPNQKYCKTCQPGLIKSFWFYPCQLPKIQDYCISFDWHYNCYFCTAGYYVNYGVGLYGTNNCTSKRVGCEVYDQTKKYCLTCKSSWAMNTTTNHFNVSENYCYFNPDPNCLSYAAEMNTCEGCKTGYSLYNNKCIIIAHCEIYNGNLCSKCITGYLLGSNGAECVQIPKIPNCDIQDLTVCKKCITNYQLNANGNCVPIPKITDCESQLDYTCTKCISGYTLQNNQCKYYIPNCIEMVDKKCIKCSSLFYVNQMSTCTTAPKIPQCVEQDGLTCLKCSTHYIFNSNNDLCEYNIQNCLLMSGLTCSSCFQGFILSQNQCIARTIIYDVNCRRYDQVSIIGKCLQCSQGYILNDTKCLQVDPLCKTYDLKTGFCLTCYVGYKLNSLNGKCVIAPADQPALLNCNQFDYVKNVCIKCASGSTFDLGGKCQKINDYNCMIPSADMLTCIQCYNGYYYDLTIKKCTVSKLNCLSFNNQGKCATCPSGYTLDPATSVCNYIDQYCKTIHPVTKKCSSCYQGYGLNNQYICQDVNTLPAQYKKYFINCSKFDSNGSCSECYFRWVLAKDNKGTFCQQVSDSCRTYQPKTGSCITCYLGYYLSNGNCLRYM